MEVGGSHNQFKGSSDSSWLTSSSWYPPRVARVEFLGYPACLHSERERCPKIQSRQRWLSIEERPVDAMANFIANPNGVQ